MTASDIMTTSALALTWLDAAPAPADGYALLANETWFYRMLWTRHGERFGIVFGSDPRKAVDRRLDAALGQQVAAHLAARAAGPWAVWCEEAMGALMLAHLLHLCRPGDRCAQAFIGHVHQHFTTEAERLFRVSPLHRLCFDHNFREMGLPNPGVHVPRLRWGITDDQQRLVLDAYWHTHVILFATGTLSRPLGDPAMLEESICFITAQAPRIAAERWTDLCAEFALCLAVYGRRDGVFRMLIDTLMHTQEADGRWTHPSYSVSQTRHATMLSMLAVLEELWPHAG
jgi:hypothetical protein